VLGIRPITIIVQSDLVQNDHTCSAAATKLFDFQLHFLFPVIICPPEQWSLQLFLLFRPLKNVYDDDDDDMQKHEQS